MFPQFATNYVFFLVLIFYLIFIIIFVLISNIFILYQINTKIWVNRFERVKYAKINI